MTVRLLPLSCNRGALNMAIDEALLLAGTPTLRFYTWAQPCVSLGHFQKCGEINLPYLEKEGIELVRRLSGGKGVYHDRELTYSIILPENQLPSGIPSSYKLIGDALLAGLGRAGLTVHQRPNPDRRRGAANCFQAAGWYEIYADEKKLVGNAQIRRQGWLLQQGSILLDLQETLWQNCFPSVAQTPTGGFTAVNNLLGEPLSSQNLAEHLSAGFREILPWPLQAGTLTADELAAAAKLATDKYDTPAWNFSR